MLISYIINALRGNMLHYFWREPLGVREFANPSFLSYKIIFDYGGARYSSCGFLSAPSLWMPAGATVKRILPHFAADIGPLDAVLDFREKWLYKLQSGEGHRFFIKHTSCHFNVAVKLEEFLIHCKYYDQSTDIADFVDVFYSRRYSDLFFQRDVKYYRDRDGKVEDFEINAMPYITLFRA